MAFQLRLTNVEVEQEENVTTGTCELCLGTVDMEYEYLLFETTCGKTFRVENGMWDYGDYFKLWHIDNLPAFADWLEHNKLNGTPPNPGDWSEVVSMISSAVWAYDGDDDDLLTPYWPVRDTTEAEDA